MAKQDYIAIAVDFEKIPHRKTFDDSEVQKMAHDSIMKLLHADKVELELKALKDSMNGEIKKLREEAKILRNNIGAKSTNIEIEVAHVPDHEKKVMHYINVEDNEIVFTRPLTPDERQLKEHRLMANG